MKKLVSLLLTLLMVISLVPAMAEKDIPKVGIIQLVTHVALDSAREGFVKALEDNGYIDGETVTIDAENGQGDSSNLASIADKFVSEECDLVLAIATGAAQTMAGKTTTIPILGTAITDYETAKLVKSNEEPGYNVSGTSDMNPVADQIALLQEIAPEAETVGVIYTSSEDNSIVQAAMAKTAIEEAGLTYTEVTVTNSNDVQQAITDLCGKCDAIYIPTDNVLASSMPIVYGVTTEAKMPVITGESGMCSAGGLATLGVDYYQLGYQTGLMAVEILKDGTDVSTMPIQYATGFEYYVNATVAGEIGIEIPEEYQQYMQDMVVAE